jgi:hypothetical protein
MPEMPRMPEKPERPAPRAEVVPAEPAPRKHKRFRGMRFFLLLIVLFLCGGIAAMFAFAEPILAGMSIGIASPFALIAIHYKLWGKSLHEHLRAEVAAEEAAEIAAGKRSPEREFPEDEPWLRGEERE